MSQQSTSLPTKGHGEHDIQPNLGNPEDSTKTINVGSRRSNLAIIQTKKVIEELIKAYGGQNAASKPSDTPIVESNKYNFQIIAMTTTGDEILDRSLPTIGTKSLFTRELETALLNYEVDCIVHSLKDLPTTLPEGCIIGAILSRDDANDVLVLKKCLNNHLDPLSLLNGTHTGCIKIGTSSQRRIALLKRCNQNIDCIDIRGNLNTRFKKLDDANSEYTAIVLAAAGLDRMDMSDRASLHMDTKSDPRMSEIRWPYAVGQGAIAVECRINDTKILDLLKPVVCLKTTYEAAAERAMMKYLEGGCSVPMGVRCRWITEHTLELTGVVLSLNGEKLVECSCSKDLSQPQDVPLVRELIDLTGIVVANRNNSFHDSHLIASITLGYEVALEMMEKGAKNILIENVGA